MSTSNATATLDASKLIFTGTASRRGRHVSVTPANSEMAHLYYGRVILDAGTPRVAFATEARETALLSMRGACSITVDGTRYDIGLHDAIYIPRGSSVVVETHRRGRPGRVRRRGERHVPAAGDPLRRAVGGPEAEVPRRRRGDDARSQHRHRRQREGRAAS